MHGKGNNNERSDGSKKNKKQESHSPIREENTERDHSNERNYKTTSIPNRSSQSKLGSCNETPSRIQEISAKLRRSIETARKELQIGKNLSIHDIQDIEKRTTLEYAKQNNLWIDDFYTLGRYTNIGGIENTIALDATNGIIYKSNNLFNTQHLISNLLCQVEIHNKIFPETTYEFIGFTGLDHGIQRVPHIEVILKQDFIPNAVKASIREIAIYMKSLDFVSVTDSTFTNGQYTVSDLHPRNVLKTNNGIIYVVDNMISEVKD